MRALKVVIAALLLSCAPVWAQPPPFTLPLKVLHTFDIPTTPRYPSGITGLADSSALIVTADDGYAGPMVVRVTADGAVTVLHAFPRKNSSSAPNERLVPGPDGRFYGFTHFGGDFSLGSVFSVGLDGSFSTVYSFHGTADGQNVQAIRRAPDGTLYVSAFGSVGDPSYHVLLIHDNGSVEPGAFTVPGPILAVSPDGAAYGFVTAVCFGCQLQIFRRAPDGTIDSVYTIPSSSVFYSNASDLRSSGTDALVGVTPSPDGQTCSLFRLTPAGFTVLHMFPKGGCVPLHPDESGSGLTGAAGPEIFHVTADGLYSPLYQAPDESAAPVDVVQMSNGATWAVTRSGGIFPGGAGSIYGGGEIFVLALDGTRSSVVSFQSGNADGAWPTGSLVLDPDGYVYGTTSRGGPYDQGTIYRLSRTGDFSPLFTFSCAGEGGRPTGLVETRGGALFGTTTCGSNHTGTVFRVGKSGGMTTLFVFRSDTHGYTPGPLVVGQDGFLYGRTATGGRFGGGTAFRVSEDGALTVLHDFGPADGLVGSGTGRLLQTRDGNFYGTTTRCDFTGCFGGSVFRMTARGDVTVLLATRAGGVEEPLVENVDGRIYGSFLDGPFFAIAPVGAMTTIPSPPFYARIETLASDGKFYGPWSHAPSNGLFAIPSTGVPVTIATTGAPNPVFSSPYSSPSTRGTTLVDGRDGYLYGSGQADALIDVGVIYRVPLLPNPHAPGNISVPGPHAPGNIRIIR